MTKRQLASTRETCERYLKLLAAGIDHGTAIERLAEAEGMKREGIRGRLRSGGALKPYASELPGYVRASIRRGPMAVGKIVVTSQPVYRDPCSRCGARGDFDCGHRPCILMAGNKAST